MEYKIFSHPDYKEFSGIYRVRKDGKSIISNFTLKDIYNPNRNFVRLSSGGISVSITIGRLLLLTYNPDGYEKGLIAVHINGDKKDTRLENLRWGTRKEQAEIHVSIPENFARVQALGLKYGHDNGKAISEIGKQNLAKWKAENNKANFSPELIEKIRERIRKGISPSDISKELKINRTSVYRYKN